MKRIPPGAPSPEAGLHKPTAHPAALLERARRWVLDLFQQHAHPGLVWHQFARTNDLVAHCSTLALEETGSERDRLVLYTAAWFSYTGWLFDPIDPVATSRQLAGQFLEAEQVETSIREAVLAILPLADLLPAFSPSKSTYPRSLCGVNVDNMIAVIGTDDPGFADQNEYRNLLNGIRTNKSIARIHSQYIHNTLPPSTNSFGSGVFTKQTNLSMKANRIENIAYNGIEMLHSSSQFGIERNNILSHCCPKRSILGINQ